MACCAFALYLLAHLLAPFRPALRKLGLVQTIRADAAVRWRPGMEELPTRHPRLNKRRLLAGFLAFDLLAALLVGGPVVAAGRTANTVSQTASQRQSSLVRAIHASLCRPLGWKP